MDRQRTADFATLDTLRSLTRSGCIEPLDRAAALTLTLEQLTRERDRLAHAAAEAGHNYGQIGRAVGITRQAARKRYGPDGAPSARSSLRRS